MAHLDASARSALGIEARRRAPRSSLGDWSPAADRQHPVEVMRAEEADRLVELLPLRHERMLASPFAFYRGAAGIMAGDLATTPRTGLDVQCCGDAHLANFGGFASPERDLVFDINDFDETNVGPFEWDVKRLATSFEIAGRDRELEASETHALARAAARSYRSAMHEFAAMSNLDVWYSRLNLPGMLQRWGQSVPRRDLARVERRVAKAKAKDSAAAFDRHAAADDGEIRIASSPPLVVPIRELLSDVDAAELYAWFEDRLRAYRTTLEPHRRALLDRFRLVDAARKVVGVGSVGTRCWIVLLLDRDDDPLFLQVKEASASVLEAHTAKSPYVNHGQRVVEGQRSLQAASDILLGWVSATTPEGESRDFYVRQLWDWKLSPDLRAMSVEMLHAYAAACGWTLARGHARSGDAVALAAYLGSSDRFDRAIARFADAYADQNERDFEAVRSALAPTA